MGAPVGDKYYLCNTPIMFVYFTLIKYQAALNVSKSSEAVLACDWRVYFRAQTEGGYFLRYSVNDLCLTYFSNSTYSYFLKVHICLYCRYQTKCLRPWMFVNRCDVPVVWNQSPVCFGLLFLFFYFIDFQFAYH